MDNEKKSRKLNFKVDFYNLEEKINDDPDNGIIMEKFEKYNAEQILTILNEDNYFDTDFTDSELIEAIYNILENCKDKEELIVNVFNEYFNFRVCYEEYVDDLYTGSKSRIYGFDIWHDVPKSIRNKIIKISNDYNKEQKKNKENELLAQFGE